MNKWVRGLLVSIVASLVVWFLTSSPYSPFVGPKVALADVSVPEQIVPGEEFSVSFRATNQRNRAQPGCEGFVEIVAPEENGIGGSNSEGEAGASGSGSGEDNGVPDVIDTRPARDIERLRDLDGSRPQGDASARDSTAPSATRDLQLAPNLGVIRRPDDISAPDSNGSSATDDTAPARNGEVSVSRDATLTSRLPTKPVIPDAVTVPARQQLFVRTDDACQILNPEFTLRGVSGSAVHVVADCRVQAPGVYQMTYGIHCAKNEDSLWRLDHQGYIKVEE